ncbi:MAG: transcription termination/antitermination protein NusG [Planctomycetota bacterium]
MAADDRLRPPRKPVRTRIQAWPSDLIRDLPDEPWMVLYTSSRMEKVLIKRLQTLDIPGLIFYEERLRHYPGKGYQKSLVPLLAGYLFVNAGLERRFDILRTDKVLSVLDVTDPAGLARELNSLITLLDRPDREAPQLLVRPELVPGRRIRLGRGAFAGFEGVIKRRRGQADLIVNLEMLGTSVSARVPADTVEPYGD